MNTKHSFECIYYNNDKSSTNDCALSPLNTTNTPKTASGEKFKIVNVADLSTGTTYSNGFQMVLIIFGR